MHFLLVVLLAIVSTPIVFWIWILWKNRSLHKLPGPKPWPIIGNDFPNEAHELHKQFVHRRKKYGPIFRLYTGPQIKIVIAKPSVLEYIMTSTKHISKSAEYFTGRPWLGDGLLLSTGAKWKERRRLITPTFHFQMLDKFLDTFNSAGDILIQQLSKHVDKEVDIFNLINLYSLDVICETSMGVKINAQLRDHHEYVEAVKGYLKVFRYRFFSVWERNDLLFRLFSSLYPVQCKHVKVLHDFSNSVIEKRRREKSFQTNTKTNENDIGIKQRHALLDTLLQSENSNQLSNEDIREEIDTFMFEGHDTTSSGISFTLYQLAENPEVQEKLFEEIEHSVGSENRHLSMQELNDMKYLECVIKEGMRITPSVPIIERTIQEDCCIEGINYPKGTVATLDIYGLHHSPEYYPNPDKFDPDRFLHEKPGKKSNFLFLPFSAGPRNCIGQKFAMLEMKSAIAKIIQNYKLVKVPGFELKLEMDAIFKSQNGVCLRLETRAECTHL